MPRHCRCFLTVNWAVTGLTLHIRISISITPKCGFEHLIQVTVLPLFQLLNPLPIIPMLLVVSEFI